MMKTIRNCTLVVLALLVFSVNAFALSLTNEYSITTQITQIGLNEYTFEYDVTNNNQELPQGIQPNGLDGLRIVIPDTAIISNIINPPLYTNIYPGPPAAWISSVGVSPTWSNGQVSNNNINWSGVEWDSVYPVGSTAHFGFTADNVNVGTENAELATFWNTNSNNPNSNLFLQGAYYTIYTTDLPAPIAIPAVPEPSTFLLLGAGLAGIGLLRRRFKK